MRAGLSGKLSANSAAIMATSVIWCTTPPFIAANCRYRAAHGSRTDNSKNGRALTVVVKEFVLTGFALPLVFMDNAGP
jgi:hypothetical protein